MSKDRWKPTEYAPPSLSVSRMGDLEWCLRSLYHGMVTSWRGWETTGQMPRRRLAYALKQLTTADMLLANAVHRLARQRLEALLSGSALASLAEIRDQLEHVLAEAIQTSRSRDAFLRNPKRVTMLRSAWYREDGKPDPNEIARVQRKIEPCARNLVCTPVWDRIARLQKENILIAEDFAEFTIDGMPIRLKPDLVFEVPQGITLLDWKTGDPEELIMRRQIAVYALWLILGKPQRSFRPTEWYGWIENLARGTRERFILTRQDLREAERWLLRGVADLRSLLADPRTGEPLPIVHFPLAAREQRWHCRTSCPYLDLCREDLGGSGTVQAPR